MNENVLRHGGASNIIIPRRGINLQDLQDLTSSTLRHLGIAYASAAMLSISAAPCRVSGKED